MAASFQGFRSLIENSPDAISLIDTRGEILYGSASTTRMFGYEPEELVGRNCFDLLHPEDRGPSARALQEVLAKPVGPLQWNARVRHKDGNYCWVESTAYNLLLELEVQAIVMQQRDINTRRAEEAARQQHAEELTRSNERLEEFAYTAAHDLREPLRAISAYTQMLARKAKLDTEAREMANYIVEGAARMSRLVDDLLTYARTGAHEPLHPVDLPKAVAKAVQNLALEIKAGEATVKVGWLPTVQSNEIHLVRLFQNLISNAVKYRNGRPPEIQVTAEQRGPDWVVSIADNGVGIAAEDQARVFLPFVRLNSRDVPGTGLGLAVCKKIVEGLGGVIWVQSEPCAGSTFSFTIAADDGGPLSHPQLPHSSTIQ
jgi:PAS domain S-box-containing protein